MRGPLAELYYSMQLKQHAADDISILITLSIYINYENLQAFRTAFARVCVCVCVNIIIRLSVHFDVEIVCYRGGIMQTFFRRLLV